MTSIGRLNIQLTSGGELGRLLSFPFYHFRQLATLNPHASNEARRSTARKSSGISLQASKYIKIPPLSEQQRTPPLNWKNFVRCPHTALMRSNQKWLDLPKRTPQICRASFAFDCKSLFGVSRYTRSKGRFFVKIFCKPINKRGEGRSSHTPGVGYTPPINPLRIERVQAPRAGESFPRQGSPPP